MVFMPEDTSIACTAWKQSLLMNSVRTRCVQEKLNAIIRGHSMTALAFLKTNEAPQADRVALKPAGHQVPTIRSQLCDQATRMVSGMHLPENLLFEFDSIFQMSSAGFGRMDIFYFIAEDEDTIRHYPVRRQSLCDTPFDRNNAKTAAAR